jgi:hypothetical protein
MHFNIKHLWITCCLLFVSFFIGCTQEVVVPQYLIGVWKTSSPQYEDRYLKFDAKTLTYGIGEGAEVSHTIDKIDVEQGNSGTLYSFHYRDAEGETSTLTLTYRPEGTIQIKNRNDIWMKVNPENTGQ